MTLFRGRYICRRSKASTNTSPRPDGKVCSANVHSCVCVCVCDVCAIFGLGFLPSFTMCNSKVRRGRKRTRAMYVIFGVNRALQILFACKFQIFCQPYNKRLPSRTVCCYPLTAPGSTIAAIICVIKTCCIFLQEVNCLTIHHVRRLCVYAPVCVCVCASVNHWHEGYLFHVINVVCMCEHMHSSQPCSIIQYHPELNSITPEGKTARRFYKYTHIVCLCCETERDGEMVESVE